DDATAGGMPVAYLTAQITLTQAGFEPGKTVLAPAIGGAVGNAVTQLARAQGATKAISTTTKPAKAEQARALGFDDVIDLSAERSMTSSKPRARACSALAGLVVVEIAFVAPCARANWVTALPTAPPIAGASTVLPGSKPACVSVICAVR